VIPDIRRSIPTVPTAPRTMIIVDAMAPTPTPATPPPRLVARDQSSDTNTDTEGDKRRCHNSARTWRSVDHRRVVLRDIDHLRIGRLNHIDRLTGNLLDLDLLLFIAAQRSRGVGLGAQTLDGGSYLRLVGVHSLPNRRVIVNVIRHHLDHGRERDQGKEGRIESVPLCRIGKGGAGEVRVLREPVVNVEDLLRVSGSRRNLCEQRVGIKRDRRQQLVQLLRSGWSWRGLLRWRRCLGL
jgi:hypothetical protein